MYLIANTQHFQHPLSQDHPPGDDGMAIASESLIKLSFKELQLGFVLLLQFSP